MPRLARFECALAGLAWAFAPLSASVAQTYPQKPVRFILPFPAGGATDTIGRVIAQKLGDALGQQVIVDNRPGAGGNLGIELAARSAPDGYTLLLCSSTCAISPTLYRKLGYDPVRDLAPVSLVAAIPTLLIVHPSVPAKNLKELIALARARPGRLNYGSGGVGSSNHLAMELFKSLAQVDAVHVAYKGTNQAMMSVLGGEIDMVAISPPSAMPFLQSNRLRALAVLRPKRIAALPQVPTAAEAGLPGWEMNNWYGMLTSAGTPRAIVQRLNAEVVKVMNDAETRERFAGIGADVLSSSPEHFGDYLKAEIVRLGKVVRDAGAKAE